jgi:hypothetical protein
MDKDNIITWPTLAKDQMNDTEPTSNAWPHWERLVRARLSHFEQPLIDWVCTDLSARWRAWPVMITMPDLKVPPGCEEAMQAAIAHLEAIVEAQFVEIFDMFLEAEVALYNLLHPPPDGGIRVRRAA